jgi:hypothetical protein
MLAGLFDPKYRWTFTSESVNEPARNVRAEEGPNGDDAGEDGDGNDANDGDDVERGEGGLRWREGGASHGRMMVS